MTFLQFLERVFWVTLLGAIGAVTCPQLVDLVTDTGWTMTFEQAVVTGAVTAGVREVAAFAQARLAFLPNPGHVPTPLSTPRDRVR